MLELHQRLEAHQVSLLDKYPSELYHDSSSYQTPKCSACTDPRLHYRYPKQVSHSLPHPLTF